MNPSRKGRLCNRPIFSHFSFVLRGGAIKRPIQSVTVDWQAVQVLLTVSTYGAASGSWVWRVTGPLAATSTRDEYGVIIDLSVQELRQEPGLDL